MSLTVDSISVEVQIDVVCTECGNSLNVCSEDYTRIPNKDNKGRACITVDPCETCVNNLISNFPHKK